MDTSHALNHSRIVINTLGPVRLEPLPDGRYMIHIDQPQVVTEGNDTLDVGKLAYKIAAAMRRPKDPSCAENPQPTLPPSDSA